jgi:hypothetical protein
MLAYRDENETLQLGFPESYVPYVPFAAPLQCN